ncbi:hypothetical protein PVAP13_1NG115220 [Panicum virgatum]|uniref:Uncharacterized protein n=1 Tax=Panicum virgatum TaxID=38727 RepID=A0A8T0WM44_PANVG|nr:hypothetical protein PVAP13_1NG115220 [Panicum virgatum]
MARGLRRVATAARQRSVRGRLAGQPSRPKRARAGRRGALPVPAFPSARAQAGRGGVASRRPCATWRDGPARHGVPRGGMASRGRRRGGCRGHDGGMRSCGAEWSCDGAGWREVGLAPQCGSAAVSGVPLLPSLPLPCGRSSDGGSRAARRGRRWRRPAAGGGDRGAKEARPRRSSSALLLPQRGRSSPSPSLSVSLALAARQTGGSSGSSHSAALGGVAARPVRRRPREAVTHPRRNDASSSPVSLHSSRFGIRLSAAPNRRSDPAIRRAATPICHSGTQPGPHGPHPPPYAVWAPQEAKAVRHCNAGGAWESTARVGCSPPVHVSIGGVGGR